MLVARDDLAVANSRLLTGMITFNQLAGPPLGAALFVVGSAWPFGAEALVVGLGVVLVSRVVLPPHAGADRRDTPACGTTSSRASAGSSITRRSGPWC